MSWTGWTISGAAIALLVLLVAGLAVAVVRGLWLKRRLSWSSARISPIADGISAGLADIERGVARAQDGAAELGREIDRLRVPVAELQVISRHAWAAILEIKGPLGWLAGIRALIRYRGR